MTIRFHDPYELCGCLDTLDKAYQPELCVGSSVSGHKSSGSEL